ncbi:MAG: hypothetical protein QME75_01950 [Deltaproteobacteria bacterium]|nr:hypothetical protein [Deltaproteobacteria bacterium]
MPPGLVGFKKEKVFPTTILHQKLKQKRENRKPGIIKKHSKIEQGTQKPKTRNQNPKPKTKNQKPKTEN